MRPGKGQPASTETPLPGRGRVGGATRTIAALAVTSVFALPVYLVLTNTFKRSGDIFSRPGSLPLPPTLSNVSAVLDRPDRLFWSGLINSVQVTALSVAASTVLSAMLAHYLVRSRTRAAKLLTVLVVIGLTIPMAVTLEPVTKILLSLHLMTTLPGLILVNIAWNSPASQQVEQSQVCGPVCASFP